MGSTSGGNLLKNTTIYALGDIIPKAINFVFFPILTRFLSPADYGILNYVTSVNNLLTILTFLCLNTYYMVYYFKVDGEKKRRELLGTLSIFVIALNFILCIFLFLIGPALFGRIGGNVLFYPYLALGIAINFFNIFAVLPSCMLRMQERSLLFTTVNVLKSVLTTILTAFVVISLKFGVQGVLYSQLAAAVVFAAVFVGIANGYSRYVVDFGIIKKALLFSLPLVPGSLAYFFVTLSDRIFIDKYLTLSDLGLYSTAASLALLLNTISYGAYKAFEPYVFKIYGQSDFGKKIYTVFKNYYLVLLFIGLCISLLSYNFLVIFTTNQYYPAAKYVPLLVVGCIFSSMSYLFSTVITSSGRTYLNSVISIVGGILSVILNATLIKYGVVFACFTSMAALGVMFICYVYYSQIRFDIVPQLIMFALSAGVVWAFYEWKIENVYLDLVAKLFVLGVIGSVFLGKSDLSFLKSKHSLS